MAEFYVDRQLYEGRPIDPAGRVAAETACYDFLDGLNIRYQRVDHDPAMTIADCTDVDEILGVPMCKNLFLCNRQKTAFYLLLLPGEKAFSTKDFSRALGIARVSFADAAHMVQYLGVAPGAVTALGLMNDRERQVFLVIDEDVLSAEYIGCHPCANTSSLRLRVRDLMDVFLPSTGHAPRMVHL